MMGNLQMMGSLYLVLQNIYERVKVTRALLSRGAQHIPHVSLSITFFLFFCFCLAPAYQG